MTERNSIFGIIILGAIALFLLWKSANIYYEINQMKDWVAYEAKLLTKRYDIKRGADNVPTYRNIVSYKYQVEGKSYTGDRIGFGYIHSNMDRHIQVADKLKYAKKLKVWVDPHQPNQSSITQGWNETALFFMVFTFIWVCGSIGSILWEFGSASNQLKLWSKIMVGLAITTFILLLGRIIMAKYYDKYVIKLEDKVEVTEYMTDEEIEGEKMLERARKEGFQQAGPNKTMYLKYDKELDSFILQK